jgi:predicted chitinase
MSDLPGGLSRPDFARYGADTLSRRGLGLTEQQLHYEPPSSLAKSLCNVEPGDGKRYRGRGLIWITGRENYLKFGQAVNIDLVKYPELAASPDVAARTAA